MAKRYTVFVDDNFHYLDESERYKLGEFADCPSAVATFKQIYASEAFHHIKPIHPIPITTPAIKTEASENSGRQATA